jgi:hypothetical protein
VWAAGVCLLALVRFTCNLGNQMELRRAMITEAKDGTVQRSAAAVFSERLRTINSNHAPQASVLAQQ